VSGLDRRLRRIDRAAAPLAKVYDILELGVPLVPIGRAANNYLKLAGGHGFGLIADVFPFDDTSRLSTERALEAAQRAARVAVAQGARGRDSNFERAKPLRIVAYREVPGLAVAGRVGDWRVRL
jgi:hypothetical protein